MKFLIFTRIFLFINVSYFVIYMKIWPVKRFYSVQNCITSTGHQSTTLDWNSLCDLNVANRVRKCGIILLIITTTLTKVRFACGKSFWTEPKYQIYLYFLFALLWNYVACQSKMVKLEFSLHLTKVDYFLSKYPYKSSEKIVFTQINY